MSDRLIVTFTDFGLACPYLGQVKVVFAGLAPGVPVIDLFASAPTSNPRAAAYLLAAYDNTFPIGTVFLCVVDPGVGGERPPVAVQADGRWYVGPGNGLLEMVRRRAKSVTTYDITWRPKVLSDSFHGRDLFAPVVARLVLRQTGDLVPRKAALPGADWPDDLAEIIYVDHYGNCFTGMRAGFVPEGATIQVGGWQIAHARTFCAVPDGTAFWYVNSNGLIEIAVAGGRADQVLGIGIGTSVISEAVAAA